MATTRCIVVSNGVISNVVLADPSTFGVSGAQVIASSEGNVGDGYAAGVITPSAPTIPVPQTVSMWQAKTALANAGLLTQANNAVAASNNVALQQYWATAQQLDRSDPSVATIGAALSLTQARIDELFIAANAVTI